MDGSYEFEPAPIDFARTEIPPRLMSFPLARQRMAMLRVVALGMCLAGSSLVACSSHHDPIFQAPRSQITFSSMSDLFETRGGGERDLFLSDRPEEVCATIENAGAESLELTFTRPSEEQNDSQTALSIAPGRTNYLCREADKITANCTDPGCSYRWRVDPIMRGDLRSPDDPILINCEYKNVESSQNAVICQDDGFLYKCSGDTVGSWLRVENPNGSQKPCPGITT